MEIPAIAVGRNDRYRLMDHVIFPAVGHGSLVLRESGLKAYVGDDWCRLLEEIEPWVVSSDLSEFKHQGDKLEKLRLVCR